MKCYNCKSLGSKEKDIAMKCIVGDASDCIPKIFNRIGAKTALKLIDSKDLLMKKFKENPGSFDMYSKNNLLVNFDNIPDYLVERYNKEVIF